MHFKSKNFDFVILSNLQYWLKDGKYYRKNGPSCILRQGSYMQNGVWIARNGAVVNQNGELEIQT